MRRDQRGVALVELLVALVVFAILVLIIDAVFISAHRGARKAELGADVNQNARVAMERLVAEIRESSVSQIQVGPDNTAVIFKSARPSDASSSFCLYWGNNPQLATANPGCPNPAPSATYEPLWQRYIGYYVVDTADGRELRRYFGALDDPNEPLPADPAFPPAGAVISVVAKFVNPSSPSSALSFTVSRDAAQKIFSVALQAAGQEIVQGSAVPAQEIVLTSTVVIRN